MGLSPQVRSRYTTLLLGALAALMVISIILFPDKAFHASLGGLNIWWKFVFPALLPFLILTELMIGFGAAHGLGVLFQPLMRLLFGVPGAGGLAIAMSLTAGLPVGAKVTADLRKRQLVERREGERLLAVSHLCSPVFIVTVIGVGFLRNGGLGFVIAAVHYISFLAAGLLVRFVRPHTVSPNNPALGQTSPPGRQPPAGKAGSFNIAPLPGRALDAMSQARAEDGRTFGKLLGDAVVSSVQNLLMIGGYIMMFSVVQSVLNLTQVASAVAEAVASLCVPLGMPAQFAPNLLPAVLELHLGTYAASQTGGPAQWTAAVIGAALAWGGFSVFFQVKSFLHGTDLKIGTFVTGRLLHAACAFALTFLLWNPLNRLFDRSLPSFAYPQAPLPLARFGAVGFIERGPIWTYGFDAALLLAVSLALMAVLSLLLLPLFKKKHP